MFKELLEVAQKVLSRIADLEAQLAAALAAPPAEAEAVTLANARAAEAEAKATALQAEIDRIAADDAEEEGAIAEAISKLNQALG
jgi:hypothetical protein